MEIIPKQKQYSDFSSQLQHGKGMHYTIIHLFLLYFQSRLINTKKHQTLISSSFSSPQLLSHLTSLSHKIHVIKFQFEFSNNSCVLPNIIPYFQLPPLQKEKCFIQMVEDKKGPIHLDQVWECIQWFWVKGQCTLAP